MNTIEAIKKKKPSLFWDITKRSLRAPGSKAGAIVLVAIIVLCVFASVIAPYGENQMDLNAIYQTPSSSHIFGTDGTGRDLFSRLLYGGRYSLVIGFAASLFSVAVAMVLGSLSGYFGGIVEQVIMRTMDVLSSLPSLLLSIIIATALGAGFFNTILALAISEVPSFTRMMRSQVLTERSKEYLEAAEMINCSKSGIIFRHMLPNAISPMIICFTMGVGDNITMAASLSFIGLGIQPPAPEWGALLSSAKGHILSYPYLCLYPGLFIALTVLAANLIGDGVRDALDPKLRK